MEQKKLLWIIFAVIAFVIVVAILLVFHQEIVSCDKGDHSYFTRFPEYDIQDPEEIPPASGMLSNWSYPDQYTGATGYEHSNGSYTMTGDRLLHKVWAVKDFVKLRVEAKFDHLTSWSLVFSDGTNQVEVPYTENNLPPKVFHERELQYGFDVRPDHGDLVVRRLYNNGDVVENPDSHERLSGDMKYVMIKVSDSTITSLGVYWTDETPGIQGLIGL